MKDLEEIRTELKLLKNQMSSDFQYITLGMSEMASQLRNGAERMAQLEGRMRLQDQRFGQMLDAVDQALEKIISGDVPVIQDLAPRVEALERKGTAA